MTGIELVRSDGPASVDQGAGRRAPGWIGPVAWTMLGAAVACVVVFSGGHPAPQPAPRPSPTEHIAQLHETDPSLHHQLGPNGGYLY